MITCWRCHSSQPDDRSYCTDCMDRKGEEPAPIRLGRYIVQEFLGEGAYSRVYRCWDPTIRRLVAVKKLGLVKEAREHVMKEVRACASIDHPAIVRVFDADSETGLIIMEYVDGGTLEERLAKDRAWVKENFIPLFVELGEGLRAAHLRRLMHRDIKPANILLTKDGHPKLADFGMARVIGSGEVAMSRAGSPAYMAPEVLLGEPYQLEADIHSLGCVMYEAWTGRLPFAQPGHEIALAMHKQKPVTLRPLREIDPEVDDILNQLVNGMLAPKGERISSIELVLQQLRHRDPAALPGSPPSIDEMQYQVGAIYGMRNRNRSPVLLLGHFQVAVRVAVAGMHHQDDDYYRHRTEAALVRAFAWLCALASAMNARLSQLIYLKFDGRCPYCDGEECRCPSLDRKRDPERNQELLAKLHGRNLDQAGAPKTFTQYQAMFRRIYGDVNRDAGLDQVGLHTYSEIAEATDALLHLTNPQDPEQVTILHLELSDLVAWFFALVNAYRHDYSLVSSFDSYFASGCYACHTSPCACPSIEHELKLAIWRDF